MYSIGKNADTPIFFTLAGIAITPLRLQYVKAESAITSMPSGIVTFEMYGFSNANASNAVTLNVRPLYVTVCGMIISPPLYSYSNSLWWLPLNVTSTVRVSLSVML